MFTEKMQIRETDVLETAISRACSIAQLKGCAVEFEFDYRRYRAEPSADGMGVVQEIARYPTPDEQAILYIGTCSKEMPKEWTETDVAVAFAQEKQVLVAGPNTRWLQGVHERVRERIATWMGLVTFTKLQNFSRRTFELQGAVGRIRFETYQNWETFRGCRFDVAFVYNAEDEEMGGNYNTFAWRSTTKEQERFRARTMQREIDQMKYQESEKLIADRIGRISALAKAERDAQIQRQIPDPPPLMMKSRSLGVSEITDLTRRYLATQVEEEVSNFVPALWNNAMQSTPATFEQRLGVVRDVLLRHLRYQLSKAPSMSAVYASDDGVITAADIRRVVDALEPVALPGERVWFGGVDFAASDEEGNKIVLSGGDNRFQTGVIFDPANRPVRKFRLTEEVP